MSGMVPVPEAIVEASLYLCSLVMDQIIPSIASEIDKRRGEAKEYCLDYGRHFPEYTRMAGTTIWVDYFSSPVERMKPHEKKDFLEWGRKYKLRHVIEDDGLWTLFFLEKDSWDKLLGECKEFNIQRKKIIKSFKDPNFFEKFMAKVGSWFNGEYRPVGHVSLPEWETISSWTEWYRKYTFEPRMVKILGHARLNAEFMKKVLFKCLRRYEPRKPCLPGDPYAKLRSWLKEDWLKHQEELKRKAKTPGKGPLKKSR